MTELAISIRRVLVSALLLSTVLILTGEFRWGSGALIGFSGLWVFHVIREVARLRKANHPARI